VHFVVGPDHSWVARDISVVGDGARECRVGRRCTFRLVSAAGAAQRAGHYYRVRLTGPAILVGRVTALSPAVHEVRCPPARPARARP
jgi:hypothetical protein